MTAAIGQSEQRTGFHTPTFTVRDLVLLRIAAGSATRADLQRDIAPILAPRISGSEFRRAAELAISTLGNAQLISETKGRLTATAKGVQVAGTSLGSARSLGPAWGDVKNTLILRALETHDTASVKKAVQRLEGLAAIVLQNHFSIATGRVLSPADLRAELAIVALERAFGNKIKTGTRQGSGAARQTRQATRRPTLQAASGDCERRQTDRAACIRDCRSPRTVHRSARTRRAKPPNDRRERR